MLLPSAPASLRKAMLAEGHKLQSLKNPCLAAVLAVQDDEGSSILLTEDVRGGSLADRIHAGLTPVDASEAVAILRPLLTGLAALHGAGVTHGALRPEHMRYRDDGLLHPVLTGYFATPPMKVGESDESMQTMAFARISQSKISGYLSPEQLGSDPCRSPASDVFSMGTVAWELLAGVNPFASVSHDDLAHKITTGARLGLRDVVLDVPSSMIALIERAMATDPGARFRDARELLAALDEVALTGAELGGAESDFAKRWRSRAGGTPPRAPQRGRRQTSPNALRTADPDIPRRGPDLPFIVAPEEDEPTSPTQMDAFAEQGEWAREELDDEDPSTAETGGALPRLATGEAPWDVAGDPWSWPAVDPQTDEAMQAAFAPPAPKSASPAPMPAERRAPGPTLISPDPPTDDSQTWPAVDEATEESVELAFKPASIPKDDTDADVEPTWDWSGSKADALLQALDAPTEHVEPSGTHAAISRPREPTPGEPPEHRPHPPAVAGRPELTEDAPVETATESSPDEVVSMRIRGVAAAAAPSSGGGGFFSIDNKFLRVLGGAVVLLVPISWRLLNMYFDATDVIDEPTVFQLEDPEPVVQAAAEAQQVVPIRKKVDVDYELVDIQPEPGFLVGSLQTEPGRDGDEARLDAHLSPFRIGRYEVSQGTWKRVMGTNPVEDEVDSWQGRESMRVRCSTFGVADELPVTCVSWFEAVRFANRMSNLNGLKPVYEIRGADVRWLPEANGYRLPTETEWEVAARAGGSKRFGSTDKPAELCASVVGATRWTLATYVHIKVEDPLPCEVDPGSLPVGSKQPNAFGLHDALGNVSEWVFDIYDPRGVQDTNPNRPRRAMPRPGGIQRVVRGGSWASGAADLRAAARTPGVAGDRSYLVGLRLARSGVGN